MTTDAASVLDQMVQNSNALKQKAALTPVGTEKAIPPPAIPDVPAVFLTTEALVEKATALRSMAQTLIDVADGLDVLTQRSSDAPEMPSPLAVQQAAEKAADEKFADKFKAQQEAAQAAVYGDAPAERVAAASGSPKSGWVCPEHGDASLKAKKSPSGREFTLCTACKRFEK